MTENLSRILALPVIGQGNFRRVHSDGKNVYKVEYGEGIDLCSNRAEYDNFNILRNTRLPANVSLPAFCRYGIEDGINYVDMPYIDGVPMGECFCLPGEPHLGCLPPGMERDLNAIGIDCAYGNIILRDSTYYLIDLDADLR